MPLTFSWIEDPGHAAVVPPPPRFTLYGGNDTGGTMHDIVVTVPMKGRSFSCATLLDGVIHIWWESLYYADPTGLFDILATWRDDNDIQWSQDAAGNVTVVVPPPDPGESQQISAAKAA